jgi:hypothetical protein
MFCAKDRQGLPRIALYASDASAAGLACLACDRTMREIEPT